MHTESLLFGEDIDVLLEPANGLEEILRSIPGNADLATDDVAGQRILQFRLDQDKIAEIKLPVGYSIDWGGQFENMQRAQKRLAIVVPVALSLIVALLYFTFRNGIDTGLVFASVPFACVGE